MKKAKDFTEEEKAAIIKRLKRAKPTKVFLVASSPFRKIFDALNA